MDAAQLDTIVERYPGATGRVLGVLEQVQRRAGYLPRDALEYLARKLAMPLSELYSIATFYSFFTLEALGEHVVTVCMGTACHVNGAPRIVERLERLLDVGAGETTGDGKFQLTTADHAFSLTSARCFGACSMAPVLRIDNRIFGYVTPDKIPAILRQFDWEGNHHRNY